MRRARGFTLMEVVVTLAILMIVIGALFGVVQGQQTAFFQGNLQRASQTAVRTAFAYVEDHLELAGFGMDPSLAFDFTSPVAPCPLASCPRDATSENDELVFFYRDPMYWFDPNATSTFVPVGNAWLISSFGPTSVTVTAKPGDVFAAGRILQALCPGEDGSAAAWTYFTVSQTVNVTTAGPATVNLKASDATNPFLRQDLLTGSGCFGAGTARLYFIDRFRFHVRPVTTDAGVVPYLVMDPGLPSGATPGPDDEIVVAEGIETFQVAYELTNTALPARGSIPGTAIALTAGSPDTAPATGSGLTTTQATATYDAQTFFTYGVNPPPAQRLTTHQGNIRAVRVSLRARAPATNPTGGQAGVLVPVLNQDTLPSWISPTTNYDRAHVDATIPVRNLISRGIVNS